MPTFDQIRQMYPDAANASDSDIIQRYAQITGTDVKTAASDFGIQINDPGFVPTIKRSAAQTLGGVGEIYGDATGNHKNALANYAQDVELRNPSGINSFQDIADNPGLALAEATANGLTFLVPAKGLQLAGQGLKAAKYLNAARAVDNPVTQAAVAGIPSLAGIGEDQRASGQGENLLMKYGGAGVVGAIENLGGIQRLAGINRAAPGIQETVNSFGKTPWRTVGKTVGRSMLEEGAEELAQNPIEQWAGYKDPTTSQNLYETALGGAMGALGGLGFGAYHGGRSGMQHSAIRRDIATDLLNTEQSFGRQQNLAQWESAFRNKAGEDGQQWYGDFMNTQNDVRLANTTTWNEPLADYQQRVAEAGNPFMGEGPTADFVNSQLGIGQKPVQQHYASAYNQRLPEPVIVPDSNGNPITISTVGEAYDYQHGMGKFAPQEAKVDALGYPISPYQPVIATPTQNTTPSWHQFAVAPTVAPLPPLPAAQGVKQTTPRGAASQAFETKLNTAISEGKLAQDDPIIADWHASKKLKADAVSFGQALDDKLAGPNVMPATAEQALQQKAANAVAEVKGGALNLTMKQIPVFDHVQKAFAENRIDDVIGADGKWKYTEIGKALGIERGQVMSRVDGMANKLAASQGISVEEMKAALRARTAEVRTTEMSEADKLGLSPKQQSSVFNEEDLFGNENGAEQNAEVINSVGGSQGAIENSAVSLPDGTSQDSEAAVKAAKALDAKRFEAEESARQMQKRRDAEAAFTNAVNDLQEVLDNPHLEEALSTWDELSEEVKEGAPNRKELDPRILNDWVNTYATIVEAHEGSFAQLWSILRDEHAELIQANGEFNGRTSTENEAERSLPGVQGSQKQIGVSSGQAPTVTVKKKRRVAVADEAAGRSDSEGQAGEVTAEVDPRPVLELTGESSEDVLANETAPIFELQVQDGRQLTLDLTAGETEEAPYINPDQMALDFDAAPQETTTPEQRKQAQEHADSLGGVVAWQDGDIALLRGFSALTGQPIYAASNGKYRTRVAIDAYTGNLFTPDQRDELINVAAKLEAEAQEKHAAEPFAPFTGSNIGASKSVPPGVVGVVKGWTKLLGITANVYVTTVEDAKANIEAFTGPYRAISSAALNNNEGGSMRRLPNGDYYIAFAGKPSRAAVLETVAHELGHVHEREVFEKADAATKQAIRNEYTQWLAKQKGVSAKELVASLRARKMGKLTGGLDGLTADQLTSYWKSFGEWYADQVSRWANTAEKPVGVVETFFDKLGKALRSFYNKLVNEKYLPNKTFAAYLERANGASKDSQAGEVDGKLYRRETLVFTDSTGQHFSEEVESIDIRNTEDLLNALDDVAYNQLSGALDYVSGFHATDSLDAYAYPNGDGTYKIVLPRALLSGHPETLTRVLHHELAHVADAADAINGGKNSSGIAMGVMVQKAKALYDKLPANSKLKKHLEYPFHSKYPESGSAKMQRTELYAQLVSAYLDPELSAELRAVHPTLFNFAESIVNEIEEQYQEDAESSDAGVSPSRVVHQGNHAVVRQRGAAARQDPAYGKAKTLVKQLLETVGDYFQSTENALLFGHNLAEKAKSLIPGANKYFESVRNKQVERVRQEEQIAAIAEAHYALSEAEQAKVNKFLDESTSQEKWGYQPEWVKTNVVDAAMAQRFNALSPEAQKVVKGVFKFGAEQQERFDKAVNDNLDPKDRVTRRQMYAKPYAPLKRFGDHVVVGKSAAYIKEKARLQAEGKTTSKALEDLQGNPNHYYVEFVDSDFEAIRRRDALAAANPNLTWDKKPLQKEDRLLNATSFSMLKKLQNQIGGMDANKKTKAALESLANQLYVAQLNRLHANKSQMSRKGVKGYDQDMMRAFVSQGRAEAALIANLKTHAEAEGALQLLSNAAREGSNQDRKTRMANAVMTRHLALLNYKSTPVQDLLLKTNSVYFLLTSPAYYLTNATQPFVISLPYMSAKFGGAKSWSALVDSYKIAFGMTKLFKDNKLDASNLKKFDSVGRESDALQTLIDENLVNIGMEMELGDIVNRSKVPGFKQLDATVGKMRSVVGNVEKLNRLSSAAAAYRLAYTEARNAGKDLDAAHEAGTAYARDVIQKTHGDYSGYNAPTLMMQGAYGNLPVKTLLQFKKFQFIQFGLLAGAAKQAFAGSSVEERALGRKVLGYILGTQMALAGMVGIPLLSGVIPAILTAAFGDDGEDKEEFIRRMLGGGNLAQLVTHGVPAAMGLDISKRVGMGNVADPFRFMDGQTKPADWALSLAGPSAGLASRFWQGVDYMRKGEYWKGAEFMVPNGIANASKALRFETTGVTNSRGDVVMKPEEIGFFDDVFQALGLPTTTMTDRQWATGVLSNKDHYFKEQASKIKHDYVEATRSGEGVAEARQAWMELQAARVRQGFERQKMSDLTNAPKEQAKRERNVVDGIQFTKTNQAAAKMISEL